MYSIIVNCSGEDETHTCQDIDTVLKKVKQLLSVYGNNVVKIKKII
jgi:hypothetical protein